MDTKEVRLIKVETINNKEIILCNPIISSNNTLDMLLLGMKDTIIKYEHKEKRVILDLGNKKLLFNLKKEDMDFLSNLFNKEIKKAQKYYNGLIDKKVNFILFEDGLLTTKELLATDYNPYYLKMTEFVLEKENTSLENLSKEALLKKDELEKVSDELGEYYIMSI